MTPLHDWPLADLAWELRKQESTGIHTYGPAACGHGSARGSGYCAECLRAEIERRKNGH